MPDSRPTNVRWLIVAMLIGLVFLAHFNRIAISVAGSERFIGHGLSEEQMGRVYFAFLVVYTIGMLPGGWLIDRLGPRWALTSMGVGFGICAALTGVLGAAGLAVAGLYMPLLVIRGVAGLSSVTLHPGAARGVSLWFPLSGRSFANGLVTAGALVGIAVTYPGFGWLLDKLDWPLAFVVAGAALFLMGLVWWALAADDPAGHRWANDAERDLVAAEGRVPPRSGPTSHDVFALFGNRSLVLLTLSYGAYSYVQYLYFYWIEYYFKNTLGLPGESSRAAAFTITMAMAVGMAAGGWGADRLCRRLGHAIGRRLVAVVGMGLCAVFSLLGVRTTDPQQIVWCFSLAFGVLGACEAIFWTTAAGLEPRNGGLACALLNTGGNGVGMLAPLLTPVIGNAFGWQAAIVVACAVSAVGGALWFGIDPEGKAGQIDPQDRADYGESEPPSTPASFPPSADPSSRTG
ncbi:MAG: MFS transporter [Zavarzinella sp.]|nr:MFS transporter [Zavarzinella sp.]